MRSFTVVFVQSCLCLSVWTWGVSGQAWDYSQNGANWGGDCAMPGEQSPIDLVGANVQQVQMKPLEISAQYFTPAVGEWTNDGKIAKFTIMDGKERRVSGGPMGKSQFRLVSCELHWGSTSNMGSEHKINGSRYTAELQLVHENTRGEDTEAPNKFEVIFSYFLDFVNMPNDLFSQNLQTSVIAIKTPSKGPFATMMNFPALMVDPIEGLGEYWTYEGSSTSPPCSPVQWINFIQPKEIHKGVYNRLKNMKNADGDTLNDNYREIQSPGQLQIVTKPMM